MRFIVHMADTLIGVLSSLWYMVVVVGHSAEIPIQWQNADMIIAHCQHAQSLMMLILTMMIMPLLARLLSHSIQIVSQRLENLCALPTWIFRPFSDLNIYSHW